MGRKVQSPMSEGSAGGDLLEEVERVTTNSLIPLLSAKYSKFQHRQEIFLLISENTLVILKLLNLKTIAVFLPVTKEDEFF